MKPELPPSDFHDNGDEYGHERTYGYTADQMRAFYAEGFRAGMERAAQIASASSIKKKRLHPDIPYDSMSKDTQNLVHWAAQNIAAAIRNETTAEVPATRA